MLSNTTDLVPVMAVVAKFHFWGEEKSFDIRGVWGMAVRAASVAERPMDGPLRRDLLESRVASETQIRNVVRPKQSTRTRRVWVVTGSALTPLERRV
jgi:hypothetical protein